MCLKAKTRQRRIVRVGNALKAWLTPLAKEAGPVTVSARDDVFGEHLRDLVKKAAIADYPHNGIRHSFGSYHFELHRNEQLTASEMGNSPAVIFRHCRDLVSPADAKTVRLSTSSWCRNARFSRMRCRWV